MFVAKVELREHLISYFSSFLKVIYLLMMEFQMVLYLLLIILLCFLDLNSMVLSFVTQLLITQLQQFKLFQPLQLTFPFLFFLLPPFLISLVLSELPQFFTIWPIPTYLLLLSLIVLVLCGLPPPFIIFLILFYHLLLF